MLPARTPQQRENVKVSEPEGITLLGSLLLVPQANLHVLAQKTSATNRHGTSSSLGAVDFFPAAEDAFFPVADPPRPPFFYTRVVV